MSTLNIVNLSSDTRDLLKVVASINNSIKFEAGNVIRTVSASGAIVFEAEIAETFPETFSIYELNRFLSVLNLPNMKDADLIFSGKNFVDIRSGKTSIEYKFTKENFVTHPGRAVSLPSEDLKVDLSNEELSNLQKMASVLGHKIMEFRVFKEKVFLTTTSPDLGDSANSSMIELMDLPDADDASYRIKFDHLILPASDYLVTICKAGISKFESKTKKISVFVGLERE
jgi:hypothetical protein